MVRLKSTRRGNRSRGGSIDFGAGDAAGMVAGGFEGPPRRLFCVVLAMILDSGEFGGRNEAVRFEVEQTKDSKRKERSRHCLLCEART